MKKIIILFIVLLFAVLFGCAEDQPEIENITYNPVGDGAFVITIAATNRVDNATTKSLMSLTVGGFTGTELDFTLTGAVPGTTYTLSGFTPALQSGQTYYFSFEEGAFGNYGIFGVLNDKSSPGVYTVAVP